MRNRCPICGNPSANSAYQLCMNCQSKYTVEKDGRDYIENACPDVEHITMTGTYGGHRHVWGGSHEVLNLNWKKEKGKVELSLTPMLPYGEEGETVRVVIS